MIAGMITLEDDTIIFSQNKSVENTIDYKVIDTFSGKSETFEAVSADKFFKALSIAVHNDGMPDYAKDYPDAESIIGSIRWIP